MPWILTLFENRSLLSKLVQWNVISTTLLEETASSAWIVSVPELLELPPCPLLLPRLKVKLRLCLVTICQWNEVYIPYYYKCNFYN